MSLRDLWSSFPLERVLHDDDDLIVIDKPAGISTHAPDVQRTDDAVTRLKLFLAEQRGTRPEDVYLGIHQRLDRDTSGVLLFTKRPEANGAIARQFEAHTVAKTYVAAVADWPAARHEGVLRHRIVDAGDGRMRAASMTPAPQDRGEATGAREPVRREAKGRTGGRSGEGGRGRESGHGRQGGRGDVGGRSREGGRGRAGGSGRESMQGRGGGRGHGPARAHAASAGRGLVRQADQGQVAVTQFKILRTEGKRTLLELRPETGRTHQIRVQIAAMENAGRHASIAGDAWYGGAPAPRLLLHAASLSLKHPTTGRTLTLNAPLPIEIERWIDGVEVDRLAVLTDAAVGPALGDVELDRLLRIAAGSRWGLGRSDATDAFRLVHEAADALPGIAIDVYGEFFVVHLSSPEAEKARERILDAAFALGPRGVYVKSHPKQKNTLIDPKSGALGLAPPEAVRGESAPSEIVVHEEGLKLAARLGDGLKTGIFLDQRENRRRVREMVAGKSVLNLFAYTCAFTVAAAMGKAARTVSVDATASVLERGKGNLALNGFGERSRKGTDEIVEMDVFEWLKRASKKSDRFDLVIVDPPSYATTHTSRFSARDDFGELAALALALVAPGGKLLACSNHRGMPRARLRRQLYEAGKESGRTIKQAKDWPDSSDFPAAFGQEPFLKSMLVTVA